MCIFLKDFSVVVLCHRHLQILSTLASPVKEGRSTAALVIGKLAAIEIPLKMWPDLVQLLLHNIGQAPSKELKQSTFEALGYVCEEVHQHSQHFCFASSCSE
jgi:hypothetical protein